MVVLGIGLDPEKPPVQRFVAAQGLTFTVLLDQRGSIATAYHIRAIPTLVLIDHRGNIRYRHEGYPGTTVLTRELQQLITEAGR